MVRTGGGDKSSDSGKIPYYAENSECSVSLNLQGAIKILKQKSVEDNQELLNLFEGMARNFETDRSLQRKQIRLLASLDNIVPYGHCYFVYDILQKKITWQHGIKAFFGYDQFEMSDYLDALHPVLKATQFRYSRGFVEALTQDSMPKATRLNIDSTYFRYSQSIRHKTGKYLFVRRTLIPFGYTSEGRMTAWLNLFSLINDHEIHPFKFEGCNFDSNTPDEQTGKRIYDQHIQPVISKVFEKVEKAAIIGGMLESKGMKPKFTPDCLIILDAYKSDKNRVIKKIAKNRFPDEWKENKTATESKVRNRNAAMTNIFHEGYGIKQLDSTPKIADFLEILGLLPL